MASTPPGYDPLAISLEAQEDTRQALEQAAAVGRELDQESERRAERLVVQKPNRLAQIARDPEAIARNAEWLRRMCRRYPDDGTAASCDPVRRLRRRSTRKALR